MINYRQIFARKDEYKRRLLKLQPNLTNNSGIYILTREENGFRYAYIGQAKHILDRLVQHLEGNQQHIDLSLKKHKLYSANNITGWQIGFIECNESELNDKEQHFIRHYADLGYQLRNKTSGSQGTEKFGISENKESKGYRDGIKQGQNKAIKQVKTYFDKYLDYVIKGNTNKIKERKYEEFKELLEEQNYGDKETRNEQE